jgi:hypothetical protein
LFPTVALSPTNFSTYAIAPPDRAPRNPTRDPWATGSEVHRLEVGLVLSHGNALTVALD